MRKEIFKTGYLYHVFTKSIAGYRIFRGDEDYSRMIEMLRYYKYERPPMRFSIYQEAIEKGITSINNELSSKDTLVDLIAFCIMPTHIHLILCQLKENGISLFMQNLLNSYSRYFNVKYERKGPLWQGRFKGILIETDEQLLHLTRYIHLNPTSDGLVDHPEDWSYSSYNEYLGSLLNGLTNFNRYLVIDPATYKTFVDSRKDYQQRLSEIKHLCLE